MVCSISGVIMAGQSAPSPSRQRLFGPFVFNEATGELRKHGIRVRLTGQPQQILSALIRQPGRIVTRDELHQELWNGSTFVDFEHGLNAAVNRLRQVFRDSAAQPRYIETLAGRGYRFVAEVHEPDPRPVLLMPAAPAVEDNGPNSPQSRLVGPARSKVWAVWRVAVVIVMGVAAMYLVTRLRTNPSLPTLRFSVSPPNGYAVEPGQQPPDFRAVTRWDPACVYGHECERDFRDVRTRAGFAGLQSAA